MCSGWKCEAEEAKASDVWACGVTLYQMVYEKYPFNGNTLPELYHNIINDE